MQTEITLNRTAVANVTDRCDDPNSVTTFDKTSIVNIYSQPSRGVLENESRLLWVHLVALYLITFITLKVRCPVASSSARAAGCLSAVFVRCVLSLSNASAVGPLCNSWVFFTNASAVGNGVAPLRTLLAR